MSQLKLAQGLTDELLEVIYKYHEAMPESRAILMICSWFTVVIPLPL